MSTARFARGRARFLALLIVIFAALRSRAVAGPPYVTDDPVPVDYRNWEIYAGLQYENGVPAGVSASLPFAEFNYGPMPNVQVSASFPMSLGSASNGNPYEYGPTDFGIKTRFVQESSVVPQIAFYPSVETGGGEATSIFLPIWMQKSVGRWTAFGGGGAYLSSVPAERGGYFVGGALTRDVSPATSLGVEVFRSRSNALQPSSTAFNVGATVSLGALHAVLFSVGRAFDTSASLTTYLSYQFRLGPVVR